MNKEFNIPHLQNLPLPADPMKEFRVMHQETLLRLDALVELQRQTLAAIQALARQ